MAYNHGREDRKWRIWKEAEEKLLRECGVDEATIEQIRIADRADFNSNRRFYRWTNDIAEYLEDMADRERQRPCGDGGGPPGEHGSGCGGYCSAASGIGWPGRGQLFDRQSGVSV